MTTQAVIAFGCHQTSCLPMPDDRNRIDGRSVR
jgi:hypothetical protein